MNAPIAKIAARTAAALALGLVCTPAFADGMPRRGSIKDAPPPEKPRCTHSANVALTTDYVFRGVSQTSEGPAIQGGFDLTCGIFYAGVWASNLDWGSANGENVANIEMDWYAGVKPKTGRITWDLGVIYYTYPNALDLGLDAAGNAVKAEYNYVELKVGGSAELWKDATLGVTVFYSPDYQYETGNVWTVEAAFTQALPKFTALRREWSPSFSALIGYQKATSDEAKYINNVTGDDDHYLYWNAGLTLGFLEKWSIDVRYWDTNIDKATPGASCSQPLFSCDQRVVGTLKFTF
jgi:uncharacterized protein (TIGR02001 family)